MFVLALSFPFQCIGGGRRLGIISMISFFRLDTSWAGLSNPGENNRNRSGIQKPGHSGDGRGKVMENTRPGESGHLNATTASLFSDWPCWRPSE